MATWSLQSGSWRGILGAFHDNAVSVEWILKQWISALAVHYPHRRGLNGRGLAFTDQYLDVDFDHMGEEFIKEAFLQAGHPRIGLHRLA